MLQNYDGLKRKLLLVLSRKGIHINREGNVSWEKIHTWCALIQSNPKKNVQLRNSKSAK